MEWAYIRAHGLEIQNLVAKHGPSSSNQKKQTLIERAFSIYTFQTLGAYRISWTA